MQSHTQNSAAFTIKSLVCYGSHKLVSGRFRTDSWKKTANSDSVSDSRRRHYKLIYTGHRAQRLSTGGRQMRRLCTSKAIVLRQHRRNATTGQRAVCPTHPTRTRTSDAPPAAMLAAAHRRRTLCNAKTTCHPKWGSNIQYLTACIESYNSNCNFNYNLFNRTREFFI